MQLPIVMFNQRFTFTIQDIPVIGQVSIEIPMNETIDSVKQLVVNELYSRQRLCLRRSQFCLTQFDCKVIWQVPSSAVDPKTPLKFLWTAKEQDRPIWSYTAWYDPTYDPTVGRTLVSHKTCLGDCFIGSLPICRFSSKVVFPSTQVPSLLICQLSCDAHAFLTALCKISGCYQAGSTSSIICQQRYWPCPLHFEAQQIMPLKKLSHGWRPP